MRQEMARFGNLSARKRRFVAAMLTATSILEAAKLAGVGERTAHRYLDDPDVGAALVAALDAALSDASRRAVAAMTGAVKTLAAIHADCEKPTGARVSAARAILEAGPKLREALDLAQRVTALEERIK